MKYVRNHEPGTVYYYRGIVRAGDVVPEVLALQFPCMFDAVDELSPALSPVVEESDGVVLELMSAPLSVAEYETLNARMALQAAEGLSRDELYDLMAWEEQNKNRRTVLRGLVELIEAKE